MKNLIFIALLALIVVSCNKVADVTPDKPIVATIPSYNFLIGTWQRTSTNDTAYTINKIDSIHYDKLFTARLLVFEELKPGIGGFALEGPTTINFDYSGDLPLTNIIFHQSLITSWRLVKISDKNIKLIRHTGNLQSHNIGYDDEYKKIK